MRKTYPADRPERAMEESRCLSLKPCLMTRSIRKVSKFVRMASLCLDWRVGDLSTMRHSAWSDSGGGTSWGHSYATGVAVSALNKCIGSPQRCGSPSNIVSYDDAGRDVRAVWDGDETGRTWGSIPIEDCEWRVGCWGLLVGRNPDCGTGDFSLSLSLSLCG